MPVVNAEPFQEQSFIMKSGQAVKALRYISLRDIIIIFFDIDRLEIFEQIIFFQNKNRIL